MSAGVHPREALLGAQGGAVQLPVCDHYSGVETRMRKSLQLQQEMIEEFGACVFDVTLDCEDGAPVGGEAEHAALVVALASLASEKARVAVRVHPVDHPVFEQDVALIAGKAGKKLAHIMLPKVERVQDIERACRAIDAAHASHLPVHALIESPAAVHRAFDIAEHPRVQSLSFGLMDFVSAHGKVPSHGVVTEFRDSKALGAAARRAAREFGYTRMWSIHPDQIRPILEAFAPDAKEVDTAARLLLEAQRAQWAPIAFEGQLQDRASYRYYWQLLERAQRTGRKLPEEVRGWFAAANAP